MLFAWIGKHMGVVGSVLHLDELCIVFTSNKDSSKCRCYTSSEIVHDNICNCIKNNFYNIALTDMKHD